MKLKIILLLQAAGLTVSADDLSFADLGQPLAAKDYKIVWECQLTNVPKSVTVFEVVPKKFSAEVISNLVQLGDFKNPGQAVKSLEPATQGKIARYTEDNQQKFLLLGPPTGEVYLLNQKAIATTLAEVVKVPEEKEIYSRGMDVLLNLQIAQTNLAMVDGRPRMVGGVRVRGAKDKGSGKVVETVLGRQLRFIRRIEGIDCSGIGASGAVWLEFGNNGTVARLEMAWRDIKAHKQQKTADKSQLEKWIRAGKCVIDADADDLANAKQFTIKRVTPHYLEKSRKEPQQFIEPYVAIDAVTDTGSEIQIVAPIVASD